MTYKIVIFGRPGAGKSTFASRLSKHLSIPLYHLDKYFFTHQWIERDPQEFIEILQQIIDQPAWVIDGNSLKSLERRYTKATHVLYFNFPKILCYWRVFKRYFKKDPAIEDRAPNCPEVIKWKLLVYMWSYEKRVATQLETLKAKHPDVIFQEITNDAQAQEYLRRAIGKDTHI